MKTAEIREMNIPELKERLEASRAELSRMKLEHAVSPVEDASLIMKTRREIARMLTVLGEKEELI